MFDCIVVVTTQEKAELVTDQVPDLVGVMSLNEEGELAEVRQPLSNKANTDPGTVFDCMRQAEFLRGRQGRVRGCSQCSQFSALPGGQEVILPD